MFSYDVYRVGEKMPELALGYDACFARLDALGVLTIYVLIDNPTAEMIEKANIDNYGMRISAYTSGSVLAFAVKPGLLPWHDAPYNPWFEGLHNLPSYSSLSEGDGLMCIYLLVDSHDGEIIGIKAFGLGTDISNHLLKEQYVLSNKEFDLHSYQSEVLRIQRRHSPWEIGVNLKQASYFFPPKGERK